MPRLLNRNPKYCKHRVSGQAIVTIAGKDIYHGSKASRDAYDRVISEWLAAGRISKSSIVKAGSSTTGK